MRGSYGNRKTTFIISLLIILLCLTFIVGITLALFTSDAGDGTIGINTTTGKVKVDIIDENENSLVGDVLDFVDADGDGEMLFEPGATFFTEGFKSFFYLQSLSDKRPESKGDAHKKNSVTRYFSA